MLSPFAKSLVFYAPAKIAPRMLTRMYSSEIPQFETLAVSVPKKHVFHVEMNRPKQLNTFTVKTWTEMNECFTSLSNNPECRVVVLSGRGKYFTGGIDIKSFIEEVNKISEIEDVGRRARMYEKMINRCQNSITSLEDCVKPVLAVVHNACVGAGVDLVTAADMRFCTQEAWFQVNEVDLGLASDVGTLQRLPKVIGNTSAVRELCFTARKLPAKEALELGLVSKVFPDQDSAIKEVLDIAETIAKKSPIAVQNTKINTVYSQSRHYKEGLDHIKLINQAALQSDDLKKAALAQATNTETEFDNL